MPLPEGLSAASAVAVAATLPVKPAAKPENEGRRTLFYGWVIVATCIMCKVAKVQGQNNIMTYTVPYLLKGIRLSDGELGAVFSVATVSASFVQPLFGRAVDRLGARMCIPLAMSSLALSLLAFSAARRFEASAAVYVEMAALFFFLRSLSMGAMETFPSACIQKWFVRRRGRALALTATMHQLGNAVAGMLVSHMVGTRGWRATARWGTAANLILAVPAALLLRRSPEACGEVPDGRGGARGAPSAVAEDPGLLDAAGSEERTAPGLGPIYALTFLGSTLFGGIDFYMVGMIAEVGGEAGGVSVAGHIFLPTSLVASPGALLVGELMDRVPDPKAATLWLLSLCCFLIFLSTNLVYLSSAPLLGLCCGVTRGLMNAIFSTMLVSGLAYSSLGVHRSCIGRVLGRNARAVLAGTGCGPLLYGAVHDLTGSFRAALQASSLPPLLFALFLVARARRGVCGGPLPAEGKLKGDSTPQGRSKSLGKPVDFAEVAREPSAEVTRLTRSEAVPEEQF